MDLAAQQLPLLGVGGGPLIPLLLHMEGAATQEEMNANIDATLKRGYVRINEYLGTYSGECSIVGAGPSVGETYTQLKGDVMACNSAIGFLLGKGIVPKFGMMWDAMDVVEKFAIPHPDITYLVGARCHPNVFKRLEGMKVIVWHAGGDHNIKEYLEEHQLVEPMINGGSAAVTRAIYLASALGYRGFHIFGADSCYSDDGKTHVNGSLVPEKDFNIWVGNGEGSKRFRTTPEWCAQIEEYKMIMPQFMNYGMSFEVYGDGMLQHVHRLMMDSIAKQREEHASQRSE